MTAFNTSFLSSSAIAASRVGKKVSGSSKYNNYQVDVYDFDNEISTFEVEAESASEASAQAENLAMSQGVQVSWLRPKSAALGIAHASMALRSFARFVTAMCITLKIEPRVNNIIQ